MGYTDPTTQTNGVIIGETEWNTDIVDNIRFLADPPRVFTYRSSNQSIPNATETTVTFNAEKFDTDAMHSTSVNTSRITAVTAGLYQITLRLYFAANSTGYRWGRIYLNGVGFTLLDVDTADAPSSTAGTVFCQVEQYLDVGEYVEASCYQTSGGALNLSGSTTVEATWFSARWIAVS